MGAVVLQAVQILVALAADFAAVWLLFLHADSTWVGNRSDGIDDGECAVVVGLEFLILVAMLNIC